MERISIRLFGGLVIENGSRTFSRFRTRRTASLLGYLACYLNQVHSRSTLQEHFWPDQPLESQRNNLNLALSALRPMLTTDGGEMALETDRVQVRLRNDLCSTDLQLFERLVTEAKMLTSLSAQEMLARAITIYGGGLLPNLDDDWVHLERERYKTIFGDLVQEVARWHEAMGDRNQALAVLQQSLAANPLNEETHREILRLTMALGRPLEARQQFRHWKKLLTAEGEEVPADVVAWLKSVQSEGRRLRGARSKADSLPLRSVSSRPAEALPSTLGTRSLIGIPFFGNAFVGRTREIDLLREMLEKNHHRLVSVFGQAGVGKTRLVAELAPMLTGIFGAGVVFARCAGIHNRRLLIHTLLQSFTSPVTDGAAVPLTPFLSDDQSIALLEQAVLERSVAGGFLAIIDGPESLLYDGDWFFALIFRLLRRLPRLTLLVTTRFRLQIEPEVEFALGPLQVRSRGQGAEDPPSDSARLFIDRAARARAGDVAGRGWETIERLCETLGGMPLAIELAAAHVDRFSPEQIMAGIQEALSGGQAESMDMFQRPLWAAMRWSFDLLPSFLQTFYTRLSVFQSAFSGEEVRERFNEPAAFELLARLRGMSLLSVEAAAAGDHLVYSLGPVRRAFALQALKEKRLPE